MIRLVAVIAAVVILVPGHVLAFNEPTGFRDVPWGATEKAITAKIGPLECFDADPQHEYGSRRCTAKADIKIGDVPVQSLAFYLRGDRLVAWSVLVSQHFRPTMLPALEERYGKATEVKGRLHLWSGSKTRVSYSALTEADYLLAVTRDEISKRDADARSRAGKAAKGF